MVGVGDLGFGVWNGLEKVCVGWCLCVFFIFFREGKMLGLGKLVLSLRISKEQMGEGVQ